MFFFSHLPGPPGPEMSPEVEVPREAPPNPSHPVVRLSVPEVAVEHEESDTASTEVILTMKDRRGSRSSGQSSATQTPRKSENIRKATAVLGAKVMNEKLASDESRLRIFVKTRLDTFMGAVVFLNITVMALMTQWNGRNSDVALNLADEPWPFFTQQIFDGLEYVFYTLYLVDVLLRAYVLRHEWCYDSVDGVQYMNIFDASLVVISTGELILLPAIFSGGTEIQANAVRLLRLIRIVRTLRIIKAVSVFRQLRVLVATCIASIGALIWSMVLLVVLKVAVSLMAGQALQTFIQDESYDLDARLEMNNLYGSFTRAFYTFFEITHSGSWPSRVRPVLEKVSPWYGILFLPYIAPWKRSIGKNNNNNVFDNLELRVGQSLGLLHVFCFCFVLFCFVVFVLYTTTVQNSSKCIQQTPGFGSFCSDPSGYGSLHQGNPGQCC